MPRPDRPGLLLTGGRIYPSSGETPVDAILLVGGRVAAVGPGAVEAARGAGAREVALRGACVTPGFVDAHVHLTEWALSRGRIDVRGAASLEEALSRVAGAAPDADGWLRGRGWDTEHWSRPLSREDLDAVAPDTPVFLDSHDLHAAWLNSMALQRCGIGPDTPDPAGGRIVRDGAGRPTGVLLEAGRALAAARLPRPTTEHVQRALEEAQCVALGYGLTGVHSVEPRGLEDFSRLRERGALRLRVLQHLQLDQLEAADRVGLRSGLGDGWIRIGGVKMFLDGALGSRTAWMREPYAGSDHETGVRALADDAFEAFVRAAAEIGLPTAVHAIGDAAVQLALEVLARVPPPGAIPHRVEHLQLCPPDLWALAGRSGVVASMQPTHLLTDVEAAERHWGRPRVEGAYPFRALAERGVVLAFGSDVPVETLDPRPGLFAATRRTGWEAYAGADAAAEWYPEHALDPASALRAYTEGPAFAAGLQGTRGALRPGFDADLTVWSADPLTCGPEHFHEMECLMTIVDGEIVHDAGLG